MKYIGSKEKISDEILSYIHSYAMINNIDKFVEPFVGGANIMYKVQIANRYGSDINKYIIALLKYVQNDGELPDIITREQYADCRAHYKLSDNKYPDWFTGAVGFLAGYNGKFYDKKYTGYTVDNLRLQEYYDENKKLLLEQASGLRDVQFDVKDYRNIVASDALIYCDPPYCGSRGVNYSGKSFDYISFWDTVREWSKHNIVLISEQQAPEDFVQIWSQSLFDENNSKIERLFIHKSHVSDLESEIQNQYDF